METCKVMLKYWVNHKLMLIDLWASSRFSGFLQQSKPIPVNGKAKLAKLTLGVSNGMASNPGCIPVSRPVFP